MTEGRAVTAGRRKRRRPKAGRDEEKESYREALETRYADVIS